MLIFALLGLASSAAPCTSQDCSYSACPSCPRTDDRSFCCPGADQIQLVCGSSATNPSTFTAGGSFSASMIAGCKDAVINCLKNEGSNLVPFTPTCGPTPPPTPPTPPTPAPCAAGKFYNTTAGGTCVSCSPGMFAVGPGATSCEACADNMTTSLSQVHLPMVGATRAGLCSDSCNGGHFWDAQLRPGATTGSCVPCPAGKFVYAPFRATVSKQQCAVCGKGNVYNDGLDTARSGQSHGPGEFCDQKCPGGKYNDLLPANATEGHTSCQLCPAGTRRALKEDMYDRPGYGSGRRRRLQGRRRIGLSQPLNGQFSSVCVPCKPGSWDDRVGSDDVDCKACPEGRCVSC